MTHPDGDAATPLASSLGISVEALGELVPGPIEAVDIIDAPAALWFAAGHPYVVLIGLAGDVAYVGEPCVTWTGAHTPRLEARQVVDVTVDGGRTAGAVAEVIRSTAARRVASFRRCEECGEMTPPEWLHSPTLCDACAERHHGVIH